MDKHHLFGHIELHYVVLLNKLDAKPVLLLGWDSKPTKPQYGT